MKRYKRGIFSDILPTVILALTLALSSCVKEPLHPSDKVPGDVLQLKIALPEGEVSKATDPGTPSENLLQDITVLVFDADGVLETKLVIDNLATVTDQPHWDKDRILLVPIKNPNKPKRIYAIANRPTEITSDYTEAQLKAEQTNTSEAVMEGATSLCMSGSKLDINLKTSAYFVTVDIARQVAKFRAKCTMTKVAQDKYPNVTWMYTDMKLAIGNVPDRSYVVEQSAIPEGHNLLNSQWFTMKVTSSSGDNYAWDIVAGEKYIFENPVAGTVLDPKKTTYIIVQLPYQNKTTGVVEVDNYYKLYVNDTESSAAPHSVRRNTIYQFNIDLLGMGVPYHDLVDNADNARGDMIVIPWKDDNINVGDTPQYYFNIDRTLIEFQQPASVQVVTIATNAPQWSLVDPETNNIVLWTDNMNLEYTNDGLTYKLSGTPALAKLTITKAAEGYTPTAKKSFYFLVNKTLTVPFGVIGPEPPDNGVIPYYVLRDASWIDGPLGGLQVAKRGNILPDGGVALERDPAYTWSSEVELVNGTSKYYGTGYSNTRAMISKVRPFVTYSAAQVCTKLGAGWYLPSSYEMKLIVDSGSYLGDSYRVHHLDSYWTSTKISATKASFVRFGAIDEVGSEKKSAFDTTCALCQKFVANAVC